MKKIIFLGLLTTLINASTGEDIFKNNCMNCHSIGKSFNKTNLIAPPIRGVVKHVKMKYKNKEEAIKFIVDYIKNPSEEKSVFGKMAILRFKIMPSMNGVMSDEEFRKVAEYIYNNYPFSLEEQEKAMNFSK